MAVEERVAVESAWDRKKRATRDGLRTAALQLVQARGLQSVTVEEIAAAADVSPRTFFNYFPTKEDAVVGWDPGLLAELVAQLRARPPEEPPLPALTRALLAVLAPSTLDAHQLLHRLRVIRSDAQLMAHQVLRFGETERQLTAVLAERRGTDPQHDHYGALVVATVLAAGRAALMAWCDDGGRLPLADVVTSHIRTLSEGLAEPAGPSGPAAEDNPTQRAGRTVARGPAEPHRRSR